MTIQPCFHANPWEFGALPTYSYIKASRDAPSKCQIQNPCHGLHCQVALKVMLSGRSELSSSHKWAKNLEPLGNVHIIAVENTVRTGHVKCCWYHHLWGYLQYRHCTSPSHKKNWKNAKNVNVTMILMAKIGFVTLSLSIFVSHILLLFLATYLLPFTPVQPQRDFPAWSLAAGLKESNKYVHYISIYDDITILRRFDESCSFSHSAFFQ